MNITVMLNTAKAAARDRKSSRAIGTTARAVPMVMGMMRMNGR
jgi:hypothetical protein